MHRRRSHRRLKRQRKCARCGRRTHRKRQAADNQLTVGELQNMFDLGTEEADEMLAALDREDMETPMEILRSAGVDVEARNIWPMVANLEVPTGMYVGSKNRGGYGSAIVYDAWDDIIFMGDPDEVRRMHDDRILDRIQTDLSGSTAEWQCVLYLEVIGDRTACEDAEDLLQNKFSLSFGDFHLEVDSLNYSEIYRESPLDMLEIELQCMITRDISSNLASKLTSGEAYESLVYWDHRTTPELIDDIAWRGAESSLKSELDAKLDLAARTDGLDACLLDRETFPVGGIVTMSTEDLYDELEGLI